jgi:hypothetical protein
MAPPRTEDEIIAEFQKRRRELQPHWKHTIGLVFFPGFVLFAIGGQLDFLGLVIPGLILCLAGFARGVQLILRYRRCPVCNSVQLPKVYHPYRTCVGCGSRLSVGAKDSI